MLNVEAILFHQHFAIILKRSISQIPVGMRLCDSYDIFLSNRNNQILFQIQTFCLDNIYHLQVSVYTTFMSNET